MLIQLLASSCDSLKFVEDLTEKRYTRRGGVPQIVQVENTQLSYRILGEGADTLLLIHGFGPRPELQWFKQIKPLARHFTLIVPDLVYFGDSYSLTNRSLFSPEYQADMLGGLLDSIGVESTHLLGLSYGGLVGAFVALKSSDKIDKVVLADAPLKFYSQRYADSLARAYDHQSMSELLLPETGADLQTLLEVSFVKPRRIKDEMLDKIVKRYYFHMREEKAALLDNLYRNEKFLSQISYRTGKETLLIWGEHDRLIPLSVGRQLQDYLGEKARLLVIPDAGHAVNSEGAKEFNRAVIDFLSPSKSKKKKKGSRS